MGAYGNGQPAAPHYDLERDSWGRLVLIDAEGRRHVGVEAVRCFPISDPERWVSLCDAEGRELVLIEHLHEVPAAQQHMVREELGQREFMPIIERIVSVSSDSAPSIWEAETDRGPTHFTLASDDDLRRLGPHRALIVDAQGLRYLVPDTRKLDAASRKLLERYF